MPTGSSRPARSSRRYSIPITGQLDGLAHEVSDENVAASRTGDYLALCGYRVAGRAGPPCPQCAAVLAAPPLSPPATRRGHHARQGVAMVALARHGRGVRPTASMSRWLLSGVELFDWMALRRISHGGVTMLEGGEGWLDTGRPV